MAKSRKNKTVGCGCDYCMGRGIRRDFRHGAVDEKDFEEVNYRPKTKHKDKPKKKPGCPGNDGKSHLYVYTTEYNIEDLFFRYFGFHKYEARYCCGCGKSGHKTRRTEQYQKKFKSTSKWGSPEYQHEGFRAYRRKWIAQRGYTNEVYGNGWL